MSDFHVASLNEKAAKGKIPMAASWVERQTAALREMVVPVQKTTMRPSPSPHSIFSFAGCGSIRDVLMHLWHSVTMRKVESAV
jgi:hypothetical protein